MKDEDVTIKFDTFDELKRVLDNMHPKAKRQFYLKTTKDAYLKAMRKINSMS